MCIKILLPQFKQQKTKPITYAKLAYETDVVGRFGKKIKLVSDVTPRKKRITVSKPIKAYYITVASITPTLKITGKQENHF